MEKQSRIQSVVYRRASHGADLEKMRLNDELCDVTIKINEKEFRAHKVILAAGIKYFHSMFLSNFQESYQSVIKMTTVKEANIEALIGFAYTGKIRITDDNVFGLLNDVDYLNVNDVKEACIGFLMQNLTFKNALQTYHLAQSINCNALKEAALKLMLMDFKKFSLSKEYLELEFIILKDFLSDLESGESQCYFEGIVRWLVYDVPERGAYVKDLLSMISICDLTADYLIGYLYENINQEHDAIIRNIVSYYRTRVKRKPLPAVSSNSNLRLIAINRSMLSHMQYFDFNKNSNNFDEWILSYTNVNHQPYAESTILRDKLYIVGGKDDYRCVTAVKVFDPRTEIWSSIASMNFSRRYCAVCASSKYLYVCGGLDDAGSELNVVERYDVVSNTWETLSSLTVERYNATAIIFQGNVYVIGGICKGKVLDSVERYSPGVKRWTLVSSLQEPRVSLTVTVFNDKIYVCGGKSKKSDKSSVEVFDPQVKRWQLVANMQKRRHSFLTIVIDEKFLLAIGGDNTQSGPTLEMYDTDEDEWHLIHSSSFHIKYLMGGLIQM